MTQAQESWGRTLGKRGKRAMQGLAVACPTCGAPPGSVCRATGRRKFELAHRTRTALQRRLRLC